MNISHDGKTVIFKTEPKELFDAEKSGAKCNIVHILDTYEYKQLRKMDPKKIIIQHQQEIFLRTLTNIHVTEGVFGKVIAVLSWQGKGRHEHDCEIRNSALGDHDMSINDDVKVPIVNGSEGATTICACVNCIRGMQEEGVPGPMTKSPTKLDELAPILLPRTLIHNLGRERKDKSHAEFIQELFEIYLNKLAEERGPMHD